MVWSEGETSSFQREVCTHQVYDLSEGNAFKEMKEVRVIGVQSVRRGMTSDNPTEEAWSGMQASCLHCIS